MESIPVNFLDKIKYEINKQNSPQYFMQFWKLEGQLDNQRLQQALKSLYQQVPKLSQRLIHDEQGYRYQPCNYQPAVILKDATGSTLDCLQLMLSQNLSDIVYQSDSAPVIAVKINSSEQNETLLCLLFNHIFVDAPSGYLLKELLVANYNETDSDILQTLRTISDQNFISEQAENPDDFRQASEQYRSQSAAYLSPENHVSLFYHENSSDNVLFRCFDIDCRSLSRQPGISLNSQVSAAIARALLELKSDILGTSISLSITTNVRQGDEKLIGNYVSAIPVKLTHDDIETMTSAFQQQIDAFKATPLRGLLSYAAFASGFANASPQQLMDGFRLVSSKSNAYISNFGVYNREGSDELNFMGTKQLKAGGFNFPLQGHYGLIFTLVPYADKVGMGIAVSPSVFNDSEIKQLVALIQKSLKQ